MKVSRANEMIEKALTLKKLKSKNVDVFINHKVVEVNGVQVLLEGKEKHRIIEGINKIVITTGMKIYIPFENIDDTPVYLIGDAKKVEKAQDPIHGAYQLAVTL